MYNKTIMTSALGLFLLFAFISLSSGGLYPKCWIKKGECLDSNVGPLIEAVAPQINHNIVKNASMGVESLDDCASQCFNETECRYVIMIKISVSSILRLGNSIIIGSISCILLFSDILLITRKKFQSILRLLIVAC